MPILLRSTYSTAGDVGRVYHREKGEEEAEGGEAWLSRGQSHISVGSLLRADLVLFWCVGVSGCCFGGWKDIRFSGSTVWGSFVGKEVPTCANTCSRYLYLTGIVPLWMIGSWPGPQCSKYGSSGLLGNLQSISVSTAPLLDGDASVDTSFWLAFDYFAFLRPLFVSCACCCLFLLSSLVLLFTIFSSVLLGGWLLLGSFIAYVKTSDQRTYIYI